MCCAWMTHAHSHASFTNWRRTKWRKTRRAIAICFVDESDYREISAKSVSAKRKLKKNRPSTLVQSQQYSREMLHTLNILSGSFIIYSLKTAICGLIFILLLVFYYSTKITLGVLLALLYKRPVSIDRRNLRLRQLRVKLISRVVKESSDSLFLVSAHSLRFNIQECSRSLYAFIAFRPTCFARRLVVRNLHETSKEARKVTLSRF